MNIGKKCYCLFAVISAIISVLLVAALHGYAITDWSVSSWFAGIFIVAAFFICTKCRLKDEEDNQAS